MLVMAAGAAEPSARISSPAEIDIAS